MNPEKLKEALRAWIADVKASIDDPNYGEGRSGELAEDLVAAFRQMAVEDQAAISILSAVSDRTACAWTRYLNLREGQNMRARAEAAEDVLLCTLIPLAIFGTEVMEQLGASYRRK